MAEILRMPKLGMDMEEGTLLRWLKKPGETIQRGQPIAEIETDKSSMEVESPCDGQVLCVYCEEGETVPIRCPLAAIGAPGEAPPVMGNNRAEQSGAVETPPNLLAGHSKIGEQTPAQTDGILTMPKLGMDMEAGTLLHWAKQVGESVKKGEVLAQIETDKSVMDLEAPLTGTVLKLYCGEGEQIPVGQMIAFIGELGMEPPERSISEQASPMPDRKTESPSSARETPVHTGNRKKLRASPRARKLAEKHQLPLEQILPSGPSGRIVERDVRAFLQAHPGTARERQRGETVKPLAGIRKVIAARMHQSLNEMAQANHRMDVDMTNMKLLRGQINRSDGFSNAPISLLDLISLSCVRALVDCPFANISLMEDGIHYKEYVNIGIAVDTERGLVVPVIHDADLLTLQDFHAKSVQLIEKARHGALKPDEMNGGTFTVSNLGMFGIDSFTAIINPPESCILAVGRISDRPVVVEGNVEVRPIMTMSLTYDHRILDGAPAARLLQRIQFYMENPALLLLQQSKDNGQSTK